MNIIYVIPDLKKVSGGPKTRISLFKKVFLEDGGEVIEKGNKFFKSIRPRKIDLVYVESATNRIGFIDVICLFFLRLYANKVIVYIRDVYTELFPDEYSSSRGKITLIFNKASNFYLTLIATSMAFPTKRMGKIFFDKNRFFSKRKYFGLPPGTQIDSEQRYYPDFSKKLGILYLGSTRYKNSGFHTFIAFAQKFNESYDFYVLSGDRDLEETLIKEPVVVKKVERSEIQKFMNKTNIAFAIHTRPRNLYDDITFPIKVLDFVNLGLPFFSERHIPLVELMGERYDLFCSVDDFGNLHQKIQNVRKTEYSTYVELFKKVSEENTYKKRYDKLLKK